MATQVTLNSGSVDSAGSLALKTNGTTTAVTIDTSQNVGIGTASPAYRLDVSGDAQLTNNNYIRWKNSSGTSVSMLGLDGSNNFLYGPSGAFTGAHLFYGSGGTERMRIDSSGNLLVGKTADDNTNTGLVGKSAGTLKFVNGNGTLCQFYYSTTGGLVGTITHNAVNTTYATSSDYRLKEDIAPMTGALAKVALLNPVTYKWKVDGSDGQGFIAHELAEVEAGCVTGEKDAVDADGNPVYQGIDTSFLVATLTAAIQEQQALITTLTDRITALEAK